MCALHVQQQVVHYSFVSYSSPHNLLHNLFCCNGFTHCLLAVILRLITAPMLTVQISFPLAKLLVWSNHVSMQLWRKILYWLMRSCLLLPQWTAERRGNANIGADAYSYNPVFQADAHSNRLAVLFFWLFITFIFILYWHSSSRRYGAMLGSKGLPQSGSPLEQVSMFAFAFTTWSSSTHIHIHIHDLELEQKHVYIHIHLTTLKQVQASMAHFHD